MRVGAPGSVRVVSVKDWTISGFVTVMFLSVAFMVWGLGRLLQSLFD